MKVKEIDRTANVAWSPAAEHPIYLAAGTAAQQLDATFSTTASLEIYSLNLTEPGLDMSLKGSISSDCRFHKLVWGPNGSNTSESSYSMLVGGADGGNLFMFDPAKLLKGEMALVCQRDKHTGPITALDFNPFQLNLLASGASESEIFVWDLNNPNNPMTPGAKSQPGEDVTCVAWNMQVQHILASTFAARCVVWDLRKNEPIIKVSDSTSRIRCKCVAWHPEVATQMCLASEDDHTPVIQLWDLRFASAPLKSLENHQRGILSIAWCRRDPDLLLSCGKDNRILCWNPNSNIHGGEVLCELPTNNQWSFDVAWCPRNPAVIASASFDGHVSVYSLMGGQQQVQPSSKIVDAFPGTDPYSQTSMPQPEHRNVLVTLKKPPKWLRKPVGASFGFGGKLITFENTKVSAQQQPQQQQQQTLPQQIVYISQMVTESTLLARSVQLETTINTNQFNDFCHIKLSNCTSKQDSKLWQFIKASLDANPRLSFLNLLGYDPQDVSQKINAALTTIPDSQEKGDLGVDAEELAQRMSALGSATNSLRASPNIAANASATRTPDSALNFSGDGASAFDTIASQQSPSTSPVFGTFTIATDDEVDGLISKALLTGNVNVAVDLCLRDGRLADAIILAMAGGQELLLKTQKKYFQQSKGDVTKLISAVVHQDWGQVVKSCDISCWKEALAACLTYAKPEEFPSHCETLGSRLETEQNGELLSEAMLCYICAGNVEKLAECWVKTADDANSSKSLQDLVELTMILKSAIELQGQPLNITSGILSEKLIQYANLLAAQGSLVTALSYLENSNELSILTLRHRLYQAIGQPIPGVDEPINPFPKTEIKGMSNGYKSFQQKQFTAPSSTGFAYPSLESSYQPLPQQQTVKSFPTQHPPPQPQPSQPGLPQPNFSYNAPSTPTNTGFPSAKRASLGLTAPPLPGEVPAAQLAPAPPPTSSPGLLQGKTGSKSHLSHRYPTLPQDPSIYGGAQNASYNSNYYQPNYQQNPSFSQPAANAVPTSVNYNSMNAVNSQMPNYSTSTSYNAAVPAYSAAPTNPIAPPPLINSNLSCVKPGWNDPPALKNQQNISTDHDMSAYHSGVKLYQRKYEKLKSDYESPAPITRPIFNAPEPEPMQGYPPVPGNYVPQANFASGPPQQQSHMAPSMGMQPQMMQPQQVNQSQRQSVNDVPPSQPEEPKVKAPIPTENQIVFDVYEDLKSRCVAAAQNPQMKRKLDDVARKLETLYDKLRENSLSQQTTLGLHQIVQVVQQYNYQSALQIHSQIVNTGTFSEISSFMPALKVLLQTAQQLNV